MERGESREGRGEWKQNVGNVGCGSIGGQVGRGMELHNGGT